MDDLEAQRRARGSMTDFIDRTLSARAAASQQPDPPQQAPIVTNALTQSRPSALMSAPLSKPRPLARIPDGFPLPEAPSEDGDYVLVWPFSGGVAGTPFWEKIGC